ncbi:MAG: hypothetical protein IJ629_06155 [Clostridia bacterium]|nr:hypothetical protein [Clostridia bacterium]
MTKEERAEYMHKYRIEHKEELKEYVRKYRQEHKDKLQQKAQEKAIKYLKEKGVDLTETAIKRAMNFLNKTPEMIEKEKRLREQHFMHQMNTFLKQNEKHGRRQF